MDHERIGRLDPVKQSLSSTLDCVQESSEPKAESQAEGASRSGHLHLSADAIKVAATPSTVSTGANPVPRRRFQRGSLVTKCERRYGVYRADVLEPDGTFARKLRWVPLGLVTEQSERAAWKQFQPYLDAVNKAAK